MSPQSGYPEIHFTPAPELRGLSCPSRSKVVKYMPEAAEMRAHPGEWFKLLTATTDNAAWGHQHAIVTGRRAAFRPAGAFEATVRGNSVYVRFIGADV